MGRLLLIVVAVAMATGCASRGDTGETANSKGRTVSSPSPCYTEFSTWRGNGGLTQLETVGTDMGRLGKADIALATALSSSGDASTQEANLQTAAAAVQADAQAADSDLPPSCIPNFRSDLQAAMTSADKAGIDSAQAVSEVTSGDYTVAAGDIMAANNAENAGNAKLVAATASLKAYENGS
jgi:hypothetical protein